MTPSALAITGLGMIAVFMGLIMTKRLSPQVALVLIPTVVGVFVAPNLTTLSSWMLAGISGIAKTATMLTFAILYFSLMLDFGLFEPLVAKILRLLKGDPVRICLGTAVLSLLVSLDGDGATTYLIVIGAVLPLFQKTGMNLLKLTAIVMLSGGIMNILPWGGPTARIMTSLKLGADQVFVPLIVCMAVGAVWVLLVAYWFGATERKRLGGVQLELDTEGGVEVSVLPKNYWLNLALTLALMVALVKGVLELAPLFMIGFALAFLINCPTIEDQRERINAYAGNVLQVTLMIFAAGIFMGVANESGMLKALGNAFADHIPTALGSNLSVITAFASMPFTFFMTNDGFYFGVMPTLTATASNYGISTAEMARASLLGQPVHLLSPLVPSTYLLVHLAGVTFADHLRFTLKWAIGTVLVMTLTAVVVGVIYIR